MNDIIRCVVESRTITWEWEAGREGIEPVKCPYRNGETYFFPTHLRLDQSITINGEQRTGEFTCTVSGPLITKSGFGKSVDRKTYHAFEYASVPKWIHELVDPALAEQFGRY